MKRGAALHISQLEMFRPVFGWCRSSSGVTDTIDIVQSLSTVPCSLIWSPKDTPGRVPASRSCRRLCDPIASKLPRWFLLRRELEFALDEGFNALITCQT